MAGNIVTDKIQTDASYNSDLQIEAQKDVSVKTNGSEKVRVLANGNVGIGTSSPEHQLDVSGSARITSYMKTPNAYVFNTSGNYCGLGFYSEAALTTRQAVLETQTGTATTLKTDVSTPLVFGTNATERMRIDSSGNVGIGTSSPSTYGKFGVVSGVNFFGVAAGTYNSATFGPRPANDGYCSLNYNWDTFGTGNFWVNDYESTGIDWVRYAGGTSSGPLMRLDSNGNFKFNSGYGSAATAYGCRAWVYFNGTGTVAIRASGNVSSITDNGTGNYTINFTTAMPDTNYASSGSCTNTAGGKATVSTWTRATTTVAVQTSSTLAGGALEDSAGVSVIVFR